MKEKEKKVANQLLQINAIKLNPANPFTWASGWKSPIYCDNRKTLSHPGVRSFLRDAFKAMIQDKYPDAEGIAGVATGAIAIGALVADALDLPFIYIRSSAKGHGMGNLIEGAYNQGQKFVIIEDLISTGGSSLKAVEALKESGCEVMGMLAIFTYGFPVAVDNFLKSGCDLATLSNYETLIELALEQGYLTNEQAVLLSKWRESPSTWMQ